MTRMYTASITNGAYGASCYFRWFVRKSGERVLQQAWQNMETGEVEWRELKEVKE